jgi:hydrogenase assembly chaperone HypC/HupF
MCVSIPGQITNILDSAGRIALVDVSGQLRTINLGLLSLDEGAVGDWVLVHAGGAATLSPPALYRCYALWYPGSARTHRAHGG